MDHEVWELMCANFVTHDLLDAVGAIDVARLYLGDQGVAPPPLRTDLLRLHRAAMDVVHRGEPSRARKMFDRAFDLRDQLEDIFEHLERVRTTHDALLRFDDEARNYDEVDDEDADA